MPTGLEAFGTLVLWPLYAGLGQAIHWLWAVPSVALCLFWIQLHVSAGSRAGRHLLVMMPGVYLGAGLLAAPLTTLYAGAVYGLAIGLPVWGLQAWQKRRYHQRAASEEQHKREVRQRGEQANDARSQEVYGRIADEHEAAGRWTEALAALRQMQVYDWANPALKARIERVRRRVEQAEHRPS